MLPSWVAPAAGVIVAAVLLVSAAAKLRDRAATGSGLVAMGVPRVVAPTAATLLPVAEAGIAAGLLFPPARVPAAFAAIVLTALFTGAVAGNLVTGRRPPCACFGAASRRPLSGLTLVRNAVLMSLAIIATGT